MKMKKVYSYLILLLTGILNGYILVVGIGYIRSFDLSLNLLKWSIDLLVEYELHYLGALTLHVISAIYLTITAIPIFVISGSVLTYFLRLKPLIMGWINSIGILMFLIFVHVIYSDRLINFLLDATVAIMLNIFIFIKISKMIEARTNA